MNWLWVVCSARFEFRNPIQALFGLRLIASRHWIQLYSHSQVVVTLFETFLGLSSFLHAVLSHVLRTNNEKGWWVNRNNFWCFWLTLDCDSGWALLLVCHRMRGLLFGRLWWPCTRQSLFSTCCTFSSISRQASLARKLPMLSLLQQEVLVFRPLK